MFRARPAVFAALAYASVASVLFGARVAIGTSGSYVGTGVDPQIFIWSFAWWPHALLHGLNPFVTHAIWSPSGLNLAWTTSVPGLALLFAPLTLLVGPVAAFNTAAVLMPAAAAWTCFLLCRHLTGKVCPSLLGGYLFGFSSYMLGQQEGHMHMTSVFLIPLVVLVIVHFLEGSLSPRQLALRIGLLLALQRSFSTELLFTLTLAAAVGWVAAYVVAAHLRLGLRALLAPIAAGYILSALFAAPLVYYAAIAVDTHSINEPRLYAADLLNLIIPTKLTLVSSHQTAAIAARFLGNDSERGAPKRL